MARTTHGASHADSVLPVGDGPRRCSAQGPRCLSFLCICVQWARRHSLSLLKGEDFSFSVVPGNSFIRR